MSWRARLDQQTGRVEISEDDGQNWRPAAERDGANGPEYERRPGEWQPLPNQALEIRQQMSGAGRSVQTAPWDASNPTAMPHSVGGVLPAASQPEPSPLDQILGDFDRRVEEWQKFLPGTARDLSMAGEGLQRSVAQAAGAIPALTGSVANLLGANVDPSAYSTAIKRGMEEIGARGVEAMGMPSYGPPAAETPRDRVMLGLGSGVGDALSFLMPTQAAVSRAQRVRSVTGGAPGVGERIGAGLSAQPGVQVLSGAAGGVAGETTDSPLMQMLAAGAVPFYPGITRRIPIGTSQVADDLAHLPSERARLVGAADAEGIPLRPAQVTGGRFMETVDSVLREHPLTAWLHRGMGSAQQGAFNRAIARRSGTRTDSITPEVLEDAHQRLGGQYRQIADNTSVALDDEFRAGIQRIQQDQLRRLPTDQERRVLSYVDDFADAGASLTGRQFLDVYSQLSAGIRGSRSDPELQQALIALRDEASSAFIRSNPALAGDWRELNRLYANLLVTEDAAAMSAAGGMVEGNITPGALRNAVRSGVGRRGFARGRGDLNDLARLGGIIGQTTPNSGTAQRSMLTNWLTAPAATGTGALAMGADPTTAMLAAGAGVAAPLAAHGLMHNPLTRMLARGRLPSATAGSSQGGLSPELLAAIAAAQAENQIAPPPQGR